MLRPCTDARLGTNRCTPVATLRCHGLSLQIRFARPANNCPHIDTQPTLATLIQYRLPDTDGSNRLSNQAIGAVYWRGLCRCVVSKRLSRGWWLSKWIRFPRKYGRVLGVVGDSHNIRCIAGNGIQTAHTFAFRES